MRTNQIGMDFGDGKKISADFLQFEKIITDRGSKYSVSGGKVTNRDEIKQFLKTLKKNRKYATATHNTWAARIGHEGQIWETKNDDGETGASATILRIMQRTQALDMIIVVTRWYGGVKLMGDRFKHVQDATKYFLEQI